MPTIWQKIENQEAIHPSYSKQTKGSNTLPHFTASISVL